MKREANLYQLSQACALHFVYAAFFDADPLVFIRLGHSARPYRAVMTVARSVPWPLAHAVIAHVGGLDRAAQFDRLMFHRLAGHRLRGEWFAFDAEDGGTFARAARLTFAEVTGRRLEWHRMSLKPADVRRVSP